jgi:hypothetical protein
MGKTTIKIFTGCRKKRCPKKPKYKHFFRLWTGPQSFFDIPAKGQKMARLTTEEVVSAQVSFVTAKGNPAPVEGDVVWTSSDESVATVVADATDTKKAVVTAVAPGVAQITAVADADMDVGEVREVTASGAIEVVAAEAQTAEIVFGTPQ